MDASLYDFPDLYDLVMAPNPAAQDYYRAVAQARGPSALVLCCGTGRISNALARAGLAVVGLDLSAAMLARCRADAAATDTAIALVQGDMRNFDLGGRRFDLIVIPHNSLLQLLDVPDLLACFASVARHLAPRGRLAFDIFTPSVSLLAQPAGQRRQVGRGPFVHPEHGEIVLEQVSDYDPAAQVLRATWFFSTAQQPDMLRMPMTLRQIFPQELKLLIDRADFRMVARHGDFDRRPFDSMSRCQVCECELGAG
jgi:SAM-dependent methyltransferase